MGVSGLWRGAGRWEMPGAESSPFIQLSSPGIPPCIWGWGPSGRGQLVSLLAFVLGWTHHCVGTRDRAVQSSARAEDAPGHRQGWSLSRGTVFASPCRRAEHLAELWRQGRAASTAQAGWRQGAVEDAWGPGTEQAGQPARLAQSSCHALDVPHPRGLGSLCPPEQHPGSTLTPPHKEAATHWCLLVTNSGLHFGREEYLYLNKEGKI